MMGKWLIKIDMLQNLLLCHVRLKIIELCVSGFVIHYYNDWFAICLRIAI